MLFKFEIILPNNIVHRWLLHNRADAKQATDSGAEHQLVRCSGVKKPEHWEAVAVAGRGAPEGHQ